MNKKGEKIKSFTDLIAWQEGHALVIEIYKITKYFPKQEQFGLTSQMRRCAISVTSNIAEGFGRYSYKDKNKFYYISQGSVREVQSQLLVARDVGYINNDKFQEIAKKTVEVHKIINGLIKGAKKKIHS